MDNVFVAVYLFFGTKYARKMTGEGAMAFSNSYYTIHHNL
jgi:hypothetical protein